MDLTSVAQSYLDRNRPEAGQCRWRVTDLARAVTPLDEDWCREVAEYFERAPRFAYDTPLRRRYDRFKRENLEQYRALTDAGVKVDPWLGTGPPYRDSRDLCDQVHASGRLYVYLTSSGHGPGPAGGFHPMREPAGISAGGVELCHNDVMRAVHDLFGHVMLGAGFGPRGELKATFCQMQLHSEEVHPVLLTEQIGQICWFFFGPHAVDPSGRPRRPGDPGYLPPARRPYPEQKVFAFPQRFLDRFRASFAREVP